MRKSCLDYGMDYLSRYPKSAQEMERQLLKKEYEPEEIAETIPILKELNYLNDMEYARSYILGEVARKGKSLLSVRQKLFQKGIAKSHVATIEDEHFEEIEQGMSKQIRKLAVQLENKGKSYLEIVQKLQARGYTRRDIQHAIDKSSSE